MPLIDDDETLQAFIEESKEHLDGIESDLLAIEEGGANIDSDLVNKVFRAVHSLKGGAGFLGLDKVKELAHNSENLMNLIRNEELVPTPAIISTMLDATDLLGSMIDSAATSNDVDISQNIEALQNAVSSNLDEEEKPSLESIVSLGTEIYPDLFEVSQFELNNTIKGGNNLFILEYDLIADIEQQDKTPMGVIKELQQTGQLLDSKIDITRVGDLESDLAEMQIPFFALFATIMEVDLLTGFLGIDASKIHPVDAESGAPDAPVETETPAEPAAQEVQAVDEPSPAEEERLEPAAPEATSLPQEPASASAPARLFSCA